MIRCTRCGLEAHVVTYGDGLTTAIQVTCRVCRVSAVKVGGRRSVVVKEDGRW